MCSPSETIAGSTNHNTSKLINSNNNKSSTNSTNLQSNQQGVSPGCFSTVNLDNKSSDEMPFPSLSRNSRVTAQAVSSRTYNNKKDGSLVIAGENGFVPTRLVSLHPSQEHKLGAIRSGSPNSTSDIWADPKGKVSPSSPLDYLRDIDLTPCTTLSTAPSRTPSEEDIIDGQWRHSLASLEIPDLEHSMRPFEVSQSLTGVAKEPISPYYRKINGSVSRDSFDKSSERLQQLQSQSMKPTRDFSLRPPSRDSIQSPPRKNCHFHATAIKPEGKGSSLQQAIRKSPQDYYDKSRQLYGVPHATMQGQKYYYNQQHQIQQQHHQQIAHSHQQPGSHYVNNNSRPLYKHQQMHGQSWDHSPRVQGSSKNVSSSSSSVSSPKIVKQLSVGQNQRTHPTSATLSTSSASASGSRPTYEILKTLLRKKACLYEPDTSKAIALVTWLVGRKLALSLGYFSRQHLQSGVHAVVSDKIDSGMITRTKVNRCMQIILNSCFHYIIPRPDGSEEKGDLFMQSFASNVLDDTHLLKTLAEPWGNLEIKDEYLVDRDHDDERETVDDKSESKRVVLLCFNDNVRSAEDVLRCHNDFIRDAAISGNLNLSADEWYHFFSVKDDDGSKSDSASVANISPVLKSRGGYDIPYLTFDLPVKTSRNGDAQNILCDPCSRSTDYLGQMNSYELTKFRTSWCCKRYDHDHKLCQFAHIDVNEGWLRRNPSVHEYCDQMCEHTTVIKSASSSLNHCHLNTCPFGVRCKFAHSREEIDYHPMRYKSNVCDSVRNSCLNCELKDVCPKCHPESPRSPGHSKHLRPIYGKKADALTKKSTNSKLAGINSNSVSTINNAQRAAPIIYHKPAPPSEFEKTILFPGLQSLYRRNCAMAYAHFLGKKEALHSYSNFSDNWEDEDANDLVKNSSSNNGCFSLYSSIGGK